SAPGMQGAMRSTSVSSTHASSTPTGTTNSLLSSMAQPPSGGRSARPGEAAASGYLTGPAGLLPKAAAGPRAAVWQTAAPSTRVERAFGLPQGRGVAARPAGDDLGADRHRRLLRGAGTEVEADGRHHAAVTGLVEPGLLEAHQPLLVGAARPHDAE